MATRFPRPFSWRRKLPRASVASFLVAGLCATVAFLLVRGQALRLEAAAPGPVATVVVPVRDLPAGTVLTAEDLAEVPRQEPPPGAIGALTTAVGQVLVAPIAPGEPITLTRIAPTGLGGAVAPGRLVIEIITQGAPAGLRPGDRVDVLATFAGARPYTSVVGTELRVVDVGAAVPGLDGGTSVRLTLDVDDATARSVLGAAAAATIGIAVHGPAWSPTPSPLVSAEVIGG